MLAGNAKSLDRRAVIRLSMIDHRTRLRQPVADHFEEEKPTKRCMLLTCGIVALLASHMPAKAQAQGAKGKNCHMEQQCHWENFKKGLSECEGVSLGTAQGYDFGLLRVFGSAFRHAALYC
jgi:hypothetical protein